MALMLKLALKVWATGLKGGKHRVGLTITKHFFITGSGFETCFGCGCWDLAAKVAAIKAHLEPRC